ncbi:MAG: tetratricopeptide repeat protein [Aridibacter famidurans]|nr:tetratricopeptide repeat protein [Aridibacter famidurans]
MNKFLLVIALAAFLLSGCGLIGGDSANADANANNAQIDDPNQVPKYKSVDEAIRAGNEFLDASLYKKAINAYTQAVEMNPDHGEAHFQLGVAYSLEEDLQDLPPGVEGNSDKAFKNAVTVYKKYLKDNEDDAASWFNLGRAHGKLFEDKEAADALKKAVELDEENGLYLTEYGAALNKLARYGEAIRQLEKALEIDPDNLRAEDLLEKAQAGKKRVDYKQPEETPSSSNTNSDSNTKGTATPTLPPANTVKPPPSPPPAKLPTPLQ